MSDDREMKKKPEDLATGYYKMLQDLHQVDKKLQVSITKTKRVTSSPLTAVFSKKITGESARRVRLEAQDARCARGNA